MKSSGALPGKKEHTVYRDNLYEDVVDLYREGDIVREYPFKIEFFGELGVDYGGLQRDMFTGFWGKAYSILFEGATLLTPMIHPQTDMSLFPIIGRILSHGYLASGILPIRIALPTLSTMLLGPSSSDSIPKRVLLDTFLDYISASDRDIFRKALDYVHCRNKEIFPSEMKEELMTTLSNFGCRTMPTPSSLTSLIEQVAKYEFVVKPAAGISLIHSGIPLDHTEFWKRKNASDIEAIYKSLSLSSRKIRVSVYLGQSVFRRLGAYFMIIKY